METAAYVTGCIWLLVALVVFWTQVISHAVSVRNPWTGSLEEPIPWLRYLRLSAAWPFLVAIFLIWGHPDP